VCEEEKRGLKTTNERLSRKAETFVDSNHQIRLLEARNDQLQNSLFDIAQIVLDDADRDSSGHVTTQVF